MKNKKMCNFIYSISPMDFAQPISFKNADIGRCTHQKPYEDEDGAIPAEIVIQPEPVPTPAFPIPTPILAHVSVYSSLLSNLYFTFLVLFRSKVIQNIYSSLQLELEDGYPLRENLISLYFPWITFLSIFVLL